MEYFVPGINPATMMGMSIGAGSSIRTNEQASKAFVSLFVSQILKNMMNNEGTIFENQDGVTGFSNDLYRDILINKIAEDLSQKDMLGFNDMIGNGAPAENIPLNDKRLI